MSAALWTPRVADPLISAEEEVGSFCGIQIPARETTQTTACCEIPLPPRPWCRKPIHLTSGGQAYRLFHTCVHPNVLHCVVFVWLYKYMHICFSVCYPTCLLGGPAPGVRGVLHFQLRTELGLLCGNTPAKSVIYCPQRTRRDWQCFLKPSSRPRGRQQPPQPRLTPLHKQRPSLVREGRSRRVLMLSRCLNFVLLAHPMLK